MLTYGLRPSVDARSFVYTVSIGRVARLPQVCWFEHKESNMMTTALSPQLAREKRMVLCFAFLMGLSTPVLAEPGPAGELTEQVTPNGNMNWTTGVATATGLGVPPRNAVSAIQAREMTRAAAYSVALRNLLEVVNGIRVDSVTTVQNYVTTNTEVQTKVEGFVKDAKLISERELPTGEFETTVQKRVAGQLSQSVIPKVPQVSTPIKSIQSKPVPTKPKVTYTGLVIDARGTGAQAALAPRILNTQGEIIYGPGYPDPNIVSGPSAQEPGRMAWYFVDEAQAVKHAKVTANPIMIKAMRAAGESNSDLVIDDLKAEYIQILPEHFLFLKEGRVIIILDPK